MSTYPFAIVAAVNDHEVLRKNLLRSPDLADGSYRVLIKEGFASASLAYNSAIDEAPADTLIFVHQDVYLPSHWLAKVAAVIRKLDDANVRWGVLGSFGSRRGAAGGLGRVYTTGLGLHGAPISEPVPVETLDEIVLIIRKSSGLRFDTKLPHFHLYGTDICLHARDAGLVNFAIPAHCVHNTNQLIELPPEFYAGYHFIKRKWKKFLPIYASCMTISRFDKELRERQVRQRLGRLLGSLKSPLPRVDDPRPLVAMESDTDPKSVGYGVGTAGIR